MKRILFITLLFLIGCFDDDEDSCVLSNAPFIPSIGYDECGVCNGSGYYDNCDVCDDDPSNDCVQDCNGVWGGDNNDWVQLWGECYNIDETTELILVNSNLSGSIPSEIGELINLEHIDLTNNQLSGSIPSEIGELISLVHLDLTNNQLTGEIPQSVCDLIESNNLGIDNILEGNNLINTCE